MDDVVQMSGDFDRFDPVFRYETERELQAFLDNERYRFRERHIHIHVKRLNASLGTNVLVRCTLGFHTTSGRFNVTEEGFGLEAALKNALLALKYQVERHFDMRQDARQKAEGRKGVAAET